MNQAPVQTYHQENFTKHWIVIGFVTLALGVYFSPLSNHLWEMKESISQPAESNAPQTNWFLVARVPDVPTEKASREAARLRFDHWLDGLHKENFRILSLSEVLWRKSQSLGVPEKTVVLVFDPGYKLTYDTLAPMLAKRKIPAVWITDPRSIENNDIRYLSAHALEQMEKSKLWDIAHHAETPESFSLVHAQNRPLIDAFLNLSFADLKGTAFNKLNAPVLNRVSINPAWTEKQFVDRLQAEVPMHESSYLTVARFNKRIRGMIIPTSKQSPNPSPFSLQAASDRRVSIVDWSGTTGVDNVAVRVEASDVTGELWIFLRSDNATGDAVQIGFCKEHLVVNQSHRNSINPIADLPWSMPTRHFVATMVLQNDLLAISVNDQEILQTREIAPPSGDGGRIAAMVYHRIRGVASARSLDIVATPIQTISPTDAKSSQQHRN